MPRRDNHSKRDRNYIRKLAEDLRSFREREEAGEEISAKERKNLRARERRVMQKMKKSQSLLWLKLTECYH